MSKVLDEIERIRVARERRREEMEAARLEKVAEKEAEDAEVSHALAYIAAKQQQHPRRGKSAPRAPEVPKPARYGLEFKRMIDQFRSSVDWSALPASDASSANSVLSPRSPRARAAAASRLNVYVRKRPLSAEEVHTRFFDVVTVLDDCTVAIHEPKTRVDLTRTLDNHTFGFDAVFDESSSSDEVYNVRALTPLSFPPFRRARCVAATQ